MDGAAAPKPVSSLVLTADGFRADCGEPGSDAGERAAVTRAWATGSLPPQRTTNLELERTRGIRLFN